MADRSFLRRRARPRVALLAMAAALALGAAMPQARAEGVMDFKLLTIAGKRGCPRDCADVILARGEIDNNTADAFTAFLSAHLQDHDLRPVVLLESPGGTVVGSMQLGTVLRTIGAAVIVASARQDDHGTARLAPGVCVSACVYALMGGVRRVVPPNSLVGIHRMVIKEDVETPSGTQTQQIFGSRAIVDSLAAYTASMGVDPRLIGFAETVAPERLHIVTPREITRWKLGRPRL